MWVHDGKMVHHFARCAGLGVVAQPAIDTELWAYILQPAERSYDLERLALTYLNKALATEAEVERADEGPAQLGLLGLEDAPGLG